MENLFLRICILSGKFGAAQDSATLFLLARRGRIQGKCLATVQCRELFFCLPLLLVVVLEALEAPSERTEGLTCRMVRTNLLRSKNDKGYAVPPLAGEGRHRFLQFLCPRLTEAGTVSGRPRPSAAVVASSGFLAARSEELLKFPTLTRIA